MNYLSKKIKTLNKDQITLYNYLESNNKLQVCIPTGAGKGYLMMVDLLRRVINSNSDVFVISTHRLLLNTQHLNDIIKLFSVEHLGKVGFIFVGSSKYKTIRLQDDPILNKNLANLGLSYNELITTLSSSFEIESVVKNHQSQGRSVIILTTYHSLHTLSKLDIDTLYCDEAHTLASTEENAQFKNNFLKNNFKNSYFFTATPKDCVEETNSFLMNNEDVFGRRVGLSFKECVIAGYIVTPVIHIARPDNFTTELNLKSINNLTKFILETYSAHSDFLKQKSSQPDKIAAKILVKCGCVDEMWKLQNSLSGKLPGVKICASASRNILSSVNNYIDDEPIKDRNDYLERLQNFSDDESAIVLHFDTLSEGINVAGFTAVMFLGGRLPTIIKTLQNMGRTTRLHPIDRDGLKNGKISLENLESWIKPYCAVILPYWDSESEFTVRELARQIKSLRDEFGFDPTFYLSLGKDMGSSIEEPEMDILNKKEKNEKKSGLIEEIKNEIENFDRDKTNLEESNRINNLTLEEWFNLANDIK